MFSLSGLVGADWSAVQEIQDQCQELQSALDHLRQSNQDQAAENAQLRADLEAAHATARATGNEHTRLATEAAALSNDLQLAEENNKVRIAVGCVCMFACTRVGE